MIFLDENDIIPITEKDKDTLSEKYHRFIGEYKGNFVEFKIYEVFYFYYMDMVLLDELCVKPTRQYFYSIEEIEYFISEGEHPSNPKFEYIFFNYNEIKGMKLPLVTNI